MEINDIPKQIRHVFYQKKNHEINNLLKTADGSFFIFNVVIGGNATFDPGQINNSFDEYFIVQFKRRLKAVLASGAICPSFELAFNTDVQSFIVQFSFERIPYSRILTFVTEEETVQRVRENKVKYVYNSIAEMSGGISLSDIIPKTRSLNKLERKQILDKLEKEGKIKSQKLKGSKKGTLFYTLVEYQEYDNANG